LRNNQTGSGSFPYETFEKAVLSALREIDPEEVIGGADQPDETLTVAAELERVAATVNKIKDNLLAGGDVSAAMDVLRKLEARQAELREKEQAHRERKAVPLDEAWEEYRRLFDLGNGPHPDGRRNTKREATTEGKDDVRLRLRAVLRRIV